MSSSVHESYDESIEFIERNSFGLLWNNDNIKRSLSPVSGLEIGNIV